MKFPWSRILLAAILVTARVWGWRTLFPVRNQARPDRLVCLTKKRILLQKLTGYFSTNVEVNVDIQGFGTQTPKRTG